MRRNAMVICLVIEIVFGRSDAAEFGICAHEGFGCCFWHFYLPAPSYEMEDSQCTPGAEPAFSNLFKVVQTVLDVPLSVSVGKVKQMDCASCVRDVHYNVANLSKAVCTSIEAEKLRDGSGRVG